MVGSEGNIRITQEFSLTERHEEELRTKFLLGGDRSADYFQELEY